VVAERALASLNSRALRGRPGTEGLLYGVVEPWVALASGAFVAAGDDDSSRRRPAGCGCGTKPPFGPAGDEGPPRGVDEAYERYLQ
jgi:hypothetical protein